MYFSLRKNILFLRIKIGYFSVWKNNIIFCAGCVLYWTVDGTAGQLGTARDTGQWTDGLSSNGQRDTGRAILYWTEAARDAGQWTGQSGQNYCPYSRILRVTLASF